MTAPSRFTARDFHISEYPDPISFTQGTSLIIHEKYEGEEEWDNWFYCTMLGHTGGWVPGQILVRHEGTHRALAKEDYTARELDVSAPVI